MIPHRDYNDCHVPYNPYTKDSKEQTMSDIVHRQQLRLQQAIDGSSGEQQQLIAEVGLGWINTLLCKNSDYGGSVFKSPLLAPNLSSLSAIDVRLSDKIERLQTLLTKDAEVNESVEDTFTDIGAYCLLRKVAKILNEKQPINTPNDQTTT